MPEELIRPVRILWTRYANGATRYAADIPGTRLQWRRWAWQARLDRHQHVSRLSAVVQVEHGVYDPEPYHGGFV